MRHLGSVGLLLTFAAAALAPGAGVAAPLDFLFGGPPLASRPAYRLRRRPASPPTREIPLPVPRPHFSDDPAPKAEAPAKPELAPAKQDASKAPPESSKPPVAKPAESASPAPQPPEKPAELSAKPASPQTENPLVAPGRETAPNPVEPTAPKPADLPPKPVAPAPPAPSPATGPAEPPTPPPRPSDLATPPAAGKPETAKPETAKPTVAPSGATLAFTPRAPEDDPQCPTRLVSQKVGIEQTTLGPQPDARCTVVEPVRLADVTMPDGSKVAFPEHPTVACVTADSFSFYVRDMLSPLAKGTFGAPVAAVWTGPGLECRSRDHIFGAKLSAHGQGLAIDIAKLKLADGRIIEVGTPKTDAETAFETAARAGACGYFHTVLGPGSDSYHRTHWHFDLEVRGAHGDSKYCK